jgi:hypothetical protein
MSGVSDAMFQSAASLPTLTVSSGALTVTVAAGDGTYTDNGEIEHLTISGLTVKCLAASPVGNIYLKATAGNGEFAGASVTAVGSLNQGYTDNDTQLAVRINTGNFPIEALFETTNSVSSALGQTGTALRVVHSAATRSTFSKDLRTAVTGETFACTAAAPSVCTENNHGLRVGDKLLISALGNLVTTGTVLATGSYVYVATIPSVNTFTFSATVGGTEIEATTAGTVVGGLAAKYAGAGTPGYFTIADSGTTLDAIDFVGQQIALPANSYTALPAATVAGGSTSTTWLGKIGVNSASYKQEATGTATAIAADSSFTTSSTVGQINIVGTTGAIVDGGTVITEPKVTITLTNGVFYSAPGTVQGGTVVATQTYPSSTLVITPSADTVSVDVGTYRFTAGLPAGSLLSFSAAISNDTAPAAYTPTVLANPAQRNIAILAGAAIASTPAVSINISTTSGAAMSPITITESAAGVWKTGQVVGVCFVDGPDDAAADEDLFYTSGGNYPWGTVTTGDVKFAGNVTTKAGTLATAAAVNATSETSVNEDVANQCVYWTVYAASTTASTITINGSNVTNTGAATTGPVINTASRIGSGVVAVVGGGALDAALVLNRGAIFTRAAAALYTVSLSSVPPKIRVASSAEGLADISITESGKGKFVAGSVVIDLSDSALADSTGGSFSGTVGANAPVVTQTAASNIVWDYAITDGNTITITVRTISSDAPATFKISNVKINTVATKSGGVAPASSDFFYEISGAGMASQTYSGQWATVDAGPAAVTNADVLKSIVALIASINKQIQALQKLILKR